ncbi:hypothetical protein M441DRAFT_84060 [Trichoderma asperellum CBS 433.97]|uniref:Zn(2)-C6 fungal-type domain-containing protein n=1 Tax=Trichoderma asperellum (strain ATCC 204424 / CBS 433.97 / NBRC 101777) TaxID=1042311 RepID=A0A2T3YUH9_TRIA4|nr:hypothetical protein M441DRAFT_84060 [Trichoderma asperellum CBS 433.97]PTB36232.1 hypothetical protein M441DRAFT_84060 [Trichoderma asperellum CBS 433.97]
MTLINTLPIPRKKHAKLFHKKTRTGCQRCRVRRVKCDEARPICNNCIRLDLDCEYAQPPAAKKSSESNSAQSSASPSGGEGVINSDGVVQLAETTARRRLELELFYHYSTVIAPVHSVDKFSQAFLGPFMCQAALRSDAVLYAVCMVAALHKAHISGDAGSEYMGHCLTYTNLTLQSHHQQVANLDPDNVDFSCLTSSLLRVYRYYQLQNRSLEPYTPPVEWLRMCNTSNIVFRKAWAFIEERRESVSGRLMLEISQNLEEKNRMEHSNELIHLLRRQEPHELEEQWDDDVHNVYKRTLSCLGWLWKHRFDSDPPYGVSRRLFLFPMIVDAQFVIFVEEQRPRALIILAHYFALLAIIRQLWFVGDAGLREAQAIAVAVPPAWLGMLIQPLEILKDPSLLCNVQPKS